MKKLTLIEQRELDTKPEKPEWPDPPKGPPCRKIKEDVDAAIIFFVSILIAVTVISIMLLIF